MYGVKIEKKMHLYLNDKFLGVVDSIEIDPSAKNEEIGLGTDSKVVTRIDIKKVKLEGSEEKAAQGKASSKSDYDAWYKEVSKKVSSKEYLQ